MYVLKCGNGFTCHQKLDFFSEAERARVFLVDDVLFFDPSKRMSLRNGEIIFTEIGQEKCQQNIEAGVYAIINTL